MLLFVFASMFEGGTVHAWEMMHSPVNILTLKSEEDLRHFSIALKHMSVPELEESIEYVKTASEERRYISLETMKGAWFAAAQIARSKGYPLAATLVEYSVLGVSYSETNGQFSRAIKTTNVYGRIKKNRVGSDTFEKSDHSDLFYAIHAFDYYSSSNSQGMRIRVSDVYDFAYDSSYQSLFTSIVNNWAYLNQCVGVLTPIQVDITLDV